MDIVNETHAALKIGCEVKLRVEGLLPNENKILVASDADLLDWFAQNGGDEIKNKRQLDLFHATVKCDNCKEFGHNKRTCQRAPMAAKRKYANGKASSVKKASGVTQEESIILSSNAPYAHSHTSKNVHAKRNKEKGKRMISDTIRGTTTESRRYLRRNAIASEGPNSRLNVINNVEGSHQPNASQVTITNASGTTTTESRRNLRRNAIAIECPSNKHNLTNNVEGSQQLNASQTTITSANVIQAKDIGTSEYAAF